MNQPLKYLGVENSQGKQAPVDKVLRHLCICEYEHK